MTSAVVPLPGCEIIRNLSLLARDVTSSVDHALTCQTRSTSRPLLSSFQPFCPNSARPEIVGRTTPMQQNSLAPWLQATRQNLACDPYAVRISNILPLLGGSHSTRPHVKDVPGDIIHIFVQPRGCGTVRGVHKKPTDPVRSGNKEPANPFRAYRSKTLHEALV